MTVIKGYKGGSGSSHTPVETPDSLHSIAYAQILDLVSEGQIQGFTHGAANCLQDIYLDETPVANSDGSLNFQNVKIDSRNGTQDQLVMSGFQDVENETAVNLELKSTTPWTQSLTNLALSAVRITLSVPALQKSNTSNGDIQGYSIAYAIDIQTDSGSFYQVISSAFTGKTTSKYQRNHRIDLPPAAHGWTIRVRRLTPNQNLATIQDVVMVDSYTQIVDALLRYPNSAYVGVIVDASQFSAIPARAYDLMGRIIQVPSNYDPVARTYTGAWDGTFKQAWTNNPAWIFYDLATHPRYGLGQYVTPAQINKWTLYGIAQYCDGMVPNGFGGTEPRFTCTVFLQKKGDAYKVLQDLASVFRGISYWGAGAIQASADMPADPTYTYTAANVIDGKFTYQGSSKSTRYTVALVSWNDPNDFGRAKVKYVPDPAGIARYGVRVTQVTGVGCTSEGQAQRVGLWTLLTSRLETETVTFKVGLDATLTAPGQVIRVADPARAGRRQAGRVHAVTATSITVDSMPTVAVGDNLTVTLPSGVTETHAVTGIAGNTISVAAPGFSALPVAESVWVCESASLQAAQYRVISVLKGNTAGAIEYTITALLHNASKFAAIDTGAPITVPPISVVPPSAQATPTNVILEAFPTAGAVLASTLLIIQWDDTPNAVSYDVKWRKDNGSWQPMGTQYGLTVDLPNAAPGVYQAMVTAVNANGVSSLAAISAPYTVNDQTTQPGFAQTLANEVAAAQNSANSANAELANIASDGIVSAAEKPTVIRDWAVITAEQAGIDAQAVSFLGAGSAQQVAYDNAITALANYLGGLTTPKMWNDKSGDTYVVGATFRANFNSVYVTRQTLLNAIYAKAQNLANNAQSTANSAQGLANSVPVINPQFQGNLTGWAANYGWYEEAAGSSRQPDPIVPTYAVHAGSTTLSGSLQTDAMVNAGHLPVVPGQTVTLTCCVRALSVNAGALAYTRISWRDSNNNEISTSAPSGSAAYPTCGAIGTGTYTQCVTKVTAIAPAGSAYAVAEPTVISHTVGYFTFCNVCMAVQPSTVDEVPDGSSYARTTAASLQNGVPLQFSGGKNVLPNGSLSVNTTGTPTGVARTVGQSVSDGWSVGNLSTSHLIIYERPSSGADVLIRLAGGSSIPANGSISSQVSTVANYAVTPGTAFALTVNRSTASNVGLPAGITVTNRTYIAWLRADGTVSAASICDAAGNSVAQGSATITGVTPADAVAAAVILQAICSNSNSSPTTVGSVGQLPADMRWFNISLVLASNIDSEVSDGTTYGRTSQNDLYFSGGVNRIGLRVAGSGHQIGDQRNLKQRTVTNIPAKVPTTISYSASSGSPATATITVGAFTVLNGSVTTSYNASSASVTGTNGANVTFYLYMNDPNFAGGAQALIASTNPNDVYGGDGFVYIGAVAVAFPSSGSGSGGGGGGGSGACVCADMWLDDDTQAREAEIGYLADCLDIPTQGLRKFRRRMAGMEMSMQPCVRLTTEGGAVLECSASTPFDLPSGGMTYAPDMEGMQVVTDCGIEIVTSVIEIGEKLVCHQHYGGCSYAAGLDPDHRVYSHNSIAKP